MLRMMKKTPDNFKCQVFWFYDRTLFVRICKQELIFKVIVSLDYLTYLMISVFLKVCKRKWGGEGVCHFIWQIGINHCFQIFRHATNKKRTKFRKKWVLGLRSEFVFRWWSYWLNKRHAIWIKNVGIFNIRLQCTCSRLNKCLKWATITVPNFKNPLISTWSVFYSVT